jgi:hypothetical protein
VSKPPYQILELRLAEAGTELWTAVEAAQYARLISHDPPASAAEAQAVTRFVEAFAACAEAWDGLEVMQRTGALAGLSAHLDALQRCGLFVHWAAVDGGIAASDRPVTMPLAVLTIGRSNLPNAYVQLPSALAVTREGGPTTH